MIKNLVQTLKLILACSCISNTALATIYSVKVRKGDGSTLTKEEVQKFVQKLEENGSSNVFYREDKINVTLPFGNYLIICGEPHVAIGGLSDIEIGVKVSKFGIQFKKLHMNIPINIIIATACANTLPLSAVTDEGCEFLLPSTKDEEEHRN